MLKDTDLGSNAVFPSYLAGRDSCLKTRVKSYSGGRIGSKSRVKSYAFGGYVST